jgi:hypothetical protein
MMRRWVAIVVGVPVIALLGLARADALAASNADITTTHKALASAYKGLHAVVSTWPREEASFHQLDRKFAAECPDVGMGSPQNEPEQKLSYEVAGALWATGYHTDAKIAETSIREVRSSRWSSPSLTRRWHRYLRGLREMIALQVPDLCGDIRSWAASDYRTIPASTLQFDQHVEAIDVEIPPAQLFTPYLQSSDRTLFAQVKHLFTRFEELEFVTGQREWIKLLEVVGLNE